MLMRLLGTVVLRDGDAFAAATSGVVLAFLLGWFLSRWAERLGPWR